MDQKLLEEQFDDTIGGRFTKRVKQKSTDSTTKDIVYGTMVLSLVFPIIMAVFLVLTLKDIDYGESRESCTAPFFTNPGVVTSSKVPGANPSTSGGSDSKYQRVDVGETYATRVKLNRGVAPLNPFPCMKQN